ncbi:MAG TPA: group I intron-associated PD-(D/E)XK endonuclease [Terriglobales bacterium]|nr:group I intron-associated PD-(D/E)XK endonuclease [Terriglobales bacterium]
MGRPRRASRGRIPASEESSAERAQRGSTALHQGFLGEVAFLHKAVSLGFMVAKPWGDIYRYDFIVNGGRNFWRVQVKAGTYLMDGLYQMCVRRRTGGVKIAYTESEVDFVVAYIIPEETWYILPVREVAERRTLSFCPKGSSRRDHFGYYREAWHLLREPDGLVFG